MTWTCEYSGCQSSKKQIKKMLTMKPNGYPHDEDQNLRTCTVCRRLPLSEQKPRAITSKTSDPSRSGSMASAGAAASMTTSTGGLALTNVAQTGALAMTQRTGGVVQNGQFVMQNGQVMIQNPGTILQNGMVMQNGGMVIQNGGMVMQNGMLLQSNMGMMQPGMMQSNMVGAPNMVIPNNNIIPGAASTMMQNSIPGALSSMMPTTIPTNNTNNLVLPVPTSYQVPAPAVQTSASAASCGSASVQGSASAQGFAPASGSEDDAVCLPVGDMTCLPTGPGIPYLHQLHSYISTTTSIAEFIEKVNHLLPDAETPMDNETIEGLLEELEELETKPVEIGSVMKYYKAHANQLAKAMVKLIVEDALPWEMGSALQMLEELIMDEVIDDKSPSGRSPSASPLNSPINNEKKNASSAASNNTVSSTSASTTTAVGNSSVEPQNTSASPKSKGSTADPHAADHNLTSGSYLRAFRILFPRFFIECWKKVCGISKTDKNTSREGEQKKLVKYLYQWTTIHVWPFLKDEMIGNLKEYVHSEEKRKEMLDWKTSLKNDKDFVKDISIANETGNNSKQSDANLSYNLSVQTRKSSSSSMSVSSKVRFVDMSIVLACVFIKNSDEPSLEDSPLEDLQTFLRLFEAIGREEEEENEKEEQDAKRRKLDDTQQQQGSVVADRNARFIEKIIAAETAFEILDIDPKRIEVFTQRNYHKLKEEGDGEEGEGEKKLTVDEINSKSRKIFFRVHPDKNPNIDSEKCNNAMHLVENAKKELIAKIEELEALSGQGTGTSKSKESEKKGEPVYQMVASSTGALEKQLCRFKGCTEEVCSQCAHGGCRSAITHCHFFARQNPHLRCFFHPPPRDHAVNAVLVNGRWQMKRQ